MSLADRACLSLGQRIQRLRDGELELALLVNRAVVAAGRVVRESGEEYLPRLDAKRQVVCGATRN